MLSNIPKIFHHIWLPDTSLMPEEFQEYRRTWMKHHPDWKFYMWDFEDLAFSPFQMYNQDVFNAASLYVPGHEYQLQADILRYELLNEYGGVYVDCDMVCHKPIDELLTEDVRCFAAWEKQGKWVNNAILGSTKGHSLIHNLVRNVGQNIRVKANPGVKRPNSLSGPVFLTEQYNHLRGYKGNEMRVFDQKLFYPYSWNELHRGQEDFPDAYTTHHWNNQRKLKGVPL